MFVEPRFGRLVIYTKRIPEMITFYERYFGYVARHLPTDKIVELRPKKDGMIIMLHPAGKGQKEGQSLVKLVFDVKDVEAFCRKAKKEGLIFGPIHHAADYMFANTKDPSGNSISISSRAFAADME